MNVETFILDNEKNIRMGFFFGILIIMGIWETFSPRRKLTISRPLRWVNNLSLVFLNSFVVRLLFPLAAVGMAAFVTENGWGLFNYYQIPHTIAIIASIIIMDFIIYLQHVMVHAIPALWRLHRVHHADLDFDVTTGSRFHTLEILLSMLIKFATIVVLGPPVVAVIIFEVVLNLTAMFNHSNVKIPTSIDRVLRWFIVTPDMHRVHHSVEDDEANSNFGFNLPWWDRLFGTYIDQPRNGHEGMTIGIHKFRDSKQTAWLPAMLILPFIGKMSGYVINRRVWNEEAKNDKSDQSSTS